MKWSIAVLAVLLTASGMPLANAQQTEPLLIDPSGDVELSLYDTSNPMPGGWNAVDLVSLDVLEQVDTIRFIVGVNGFPDCQEDTCYNGGDTRTYFSYGEKKYEIQAGITFNGYAYGNLWEVLSGEFNRQAIQQITNTADASEFTYTLEVPRELLVDETGAPPRKDTELHTIYSRAFSQTSFGGPDPNNPTRREPVDMLTTSDKMGIDAPGKITITTGGSDSSGQVTLTTSAPYRASNGGEGVFRYDITARQSEGGTRTFDLVFEGAPDSWTLERPAGVLELPDGQSATFSIVVSTPFGHQHGGSESFDFKIVDTGNENVWASVELGIHYVAVPQPSGHHSTMWFHSRAFPEPGYSLSNAMGGSNGFVSMNTVEDDAGDEQAPVQGWVGTMGQDDVYHWSICLEPELLMGIDVNMTQQGIVELPFQSNRAFTDVTLTGRVLHLGPGEPVTQCFANNYADRRQTEVATLEEMVISSIGATPSTVSAKMLPHAQGDLIPFEQDSLLVLEIEANPANVVPVTRNPSGPGALELMPGGFVTLPLNEYSDARPQGLIGWNDGESGEPADLDGPAFIPTAEVKQAPTAGFMVSLVTLVGLLAAFRRN